MAADLLSFLPRESRDQIIRGACSSVLFPCRHKDADNPCGYGCPRRQLIQSAMMLTVHEIGRLQGLRRAPGGIPTLPPQKRPPR